jgi:hypothetical protein
MRSLLAILLATGFLAALALASPACGSSGSAGRDGGGGTSGHTHDGGADSEAEAPVCPGFEDAGGLLTTSCITCLASSCAPEFKTCFCDPMCIDAIRCFDSCLEDAGVAAACQEECEKLPDGSGAGEALALFKCAVEECGTDANGCSVVPITPGHEAGRD